MRFLLDAGILTHAESAEPDVRSTGLRYSNGEAVQVHGLKRKKPEDEPEYQREIDALFTVGRLIREGRILAYEYNEIHLEAARIGAGIQAVNALRGCDIQRCAPVFRMFFFLVFVLGRCCGGERFQRTCLVKFVNVWAGMLIYLGRGQASGNSRLSWS